MGKILTWIAWGVFGELVMLALITHNLRVEGIERDHPVIPVIKVEYKNGVADTTYIYKFPKPI